LASAQRLAADKLDNCVGCHMPQRPTDVPHFAFTHHRIGVHATAGAGPSQGGDDVELVPLSDVSHLSPPDRERGLGLAYFEYADRQVTAEGRRECLRRAELLLTSAAKGGLRDADVLAALAVLAWHRDDLPQAERFASEASAKHAPGSHAPANARLVLADIEMRRGDRAAAEQSFAQLVQLRRSSDDWVLLGRLRESAGDLSGAVEALRQAAAIHPFRPDVYKLLSGNCARLGDADAARKYQEIAEALSENERAPRRDKE
jgi:tetratricopeptide (TPR) repeat protein